MYTKEQYERAKAVVATLPPDKASLVQERIMEYDYAHEPGKLSEEDVARLQTPIASHESASVPSIVDFQSINPNPEIDANLPNASKLKRFTAPPEYVSKRPGAALAAIAKNTAIDPLNGPSSTLYFEPTEQQFQADFGPYLHAKGVEPGSAQYAQAYDEYKDRKWEQAYQQAAATDQPLTRAAYTRQSSNWDKLGNFLGQAADIGSSFVKGYASGKTMGMTQALDTNADREQRARNPVARGVGEFAGGVSPGSLANRFAGFAGSLGEGLGLGRYGQAALAGGSTAVADIASHAGGEALGDRIYGREPGDKEGRFAAKLLGGALLGTGLGVVGEGVAGLAQLYRTRLRAPTSPIGTELTNAESTGTATDLVSGLKPSSDVQKYLDKARGPVPGEDRGVPTGGAVEYAAADVREPIVAQQEVEHASALRRMEKEAGDMYGRNPELQQPKPMRALGDAAYAHLVERSQPEASAHLLPSQQDALGARNNGPLIDLIKRLYKPRMVLAVDAAKEAARTGGKVATIDDAAKAGFKVEGLQSEANPSTGLPHDAPSLSDGDSFPWYPQANPVEVLPKYGRDTLAAHADDVANGPAATPEQAAALGKWSFGHDEAIRGVQRGDPDAAIIQKRLEAYGGNAVDKLGVPHAQHLAEAKDAARHIEQYLISTPPVSKLPFVYRGLVLSREEAKKFLQQTEFDLGAAASSASADPAVARSFVARNADDGQIGVTLKLEHNSARDISPYAADRVKIERELMLPGNSKFETVGRYEDASNPGHYIVVAKQKPPYGDPDATMPEIEQTIHPRDSELLSVPQGYNPKDFAVVLEPRAYDALKMEQQIKALDQAGKAGTEAKVDPIWPDLMRAARIDREQFGKAWAGLKNVHHEQLTALEQRAAHAGIAERANYPEMSGNAQKQVNAALTNYGVAPQETNKALAELGDNAGVRPQLETLRGTRAYSALKEKASPQVTEGVGTGGSFTRLGGLLPGFRLRVMDPAARAVARGPEGYPLFASKPLAPGLANEPIAREYAQSGPFANLLSMGRGALAVKTGSVYDSATGRAGPGNTLSPEEKATIQRYLEQQ